MPNHPANFSAFPTENLRTMTPVLHCLRRTREGATTATPGSTWLYKPSADANAVSFCGHSRLLRTRRSSRPGWKLLVRNDPANQAFQLITPLSLHPINHSIITPISINYFREILLDWQICHFQHEGLAKILKKQFNFQISSSVPCTGYPSSTTAASTTRRRAAKRPGPRWSFSRNTWALLSRDLIPTRDFGAGGQAPPSLWTPSSRQTIASDFMFVISTTATCLFLIVTTPEIVCK